MGTKCTGVWENKPREDVEMGERKQLQKWREGIKCNGGGLDGYLDMMSSEGFPWKELLTG
jgi:hypothetical protein